MNSLANTDLTKLKEALQAFVLKRVKYKPLADDIIQDVFLKVYSRIDQLKNSEKVLAWVYQITRNTINDHYRRHKRDINTDLIDWETDSNQLNECVASCLKQLVKTLPEKYREAFELAEIQNISQTQMAEDLGISYSGVKSRVQRARQLLKNKMEEILIIKTDSYGNVLVCKDRNPCCGC